MHQRREQGLEARDAGNDRVERLQADDVSLAALADAPLGRLKDLEIGQRATTDSDVERLFTLPALETLRLHVWGPNLRRVLEALADRWAGQLDRLDLTGTPSDEADIDALISDRFPRTRFTYSVVPRSDDED
jgi:hypothetical protein